MKKHQEILSRMEVGEQLPGCLKCTQNHVLLGCHGKIPVVLMLYMKDFY